MRIWNEQLIPKLCRQHLLAMWRESLGAYKIITEDKKGYRNHPAVKEFENAPLDLWNRLIAVREEMLNRGYHPKELPHDLLVTLPFQKQDGGKIVLFKSKPWQTLEEQIAILKQKGCECKV